MARGPQSDRQRAFRVDGPARLMPASKPAAYDAAWREAAGPLAAKYTRPGQLRRGTLEVVVANSTLVQELGFQKQTY